MTAVLHEVEQPTAHITASEHYTWVCVQENCDGEHHYWRRPL
jgi:hypothetical protein